MLNAKKPLLLCIIFIFICFFISADNNTETISMDRFIELASQNDQYFQEILIDELFLKYSKTLGLPAYDLVLSLSAQYDKQIEGDNEDGAESKIGISKVIKSFGTKASVTYSTEPGTEDNESEMEIAFIQPIAQNAFGKADRLKEKIIGIEDDIAKYQIVEAYEEYYSSLIKLYYDWLSTYKKMKTSEISYEENKKLHQNTKEKFENSIADDIDVNKSYLQLLSKEESLINLQTEYNKLSNYILKSIAYPENSRIIPADFSLNSSIGKFEDEYKKFIENSRTYSTFELIDSKNEMEVNLVYNDLMPYANLIGGYRLSGDGLEMSDEKEALAYIGISIDYMPGNGSKEKAKYKQAELDKKKSILSNANKKAELFSELKNLFAEINSEKKLVDLFQKKIDSAQSILEGEEKNYKQGRSELEDLIEAVNTLEENKFEKISHLIKLNSLITDWKKLNDTLITSRENIK